MIMAKNVKMPLRVRERMPAEKVQEAVQELAKKVIEALDSAKEEIALVGVQTRGVILARRVAEIVKKKKNVELPLGMVDVTLYRDDVGTAGIQPLVGETNLSFDVQDKRIILLDDVLYTGRTVRAALDELLDFGRPKSVSLFVLVDRGHRELPIEAQFAAIKIATKHSESANLLLTETDGKDEIIVGEPLKQ